METTHSLLFRLSNYHLKEKKHKAVFFKFRFETEGANKEVCLLFLRDTSLGIVLAWSEVYEGFKDLPKLYKECKYNMHLMEIEKNLTEKLLEIGEESFPSPYQLVILEALKYKFITSGNSNQKIEIC